MLGSLSSQSSAMADYYRRLLQQRSPTEDGKTDDKKAEERKAEERKAAEKQAEERKATARNQASEARNYLDDQGNPTDALTAVSKAASGGDEERKAQLKEKLRMLVEQLKSLLQFAMRNPAMAKALAQLSREIASVAKQLGTSGPSVNVGAAQAAPAQATPAQAAPAQAATAQAAGEQAATPQAAAAQAATAGTAEAKAAAEGTQAAQGAEAAAQTQAQPTTGTGQQSQEGTGEQGTNADGKAKETAADAETGKTDENGETDDTGESDDTGETEGLGSAEMASARGQAILEKIAGDRPKDESDPELKALLTLAKALTRQAKAVIEDMARDAQRAGKNDDFKEELKDASEAVKEIQKLDTGVSAEGASAGAIVSLIA